MMVTADGDHSLRIMVFAHPPRRVEVVPHEVGAAAPFDRATEADLLGKPPTNGNWRFSSQCHHLCSGTGTRDTDLDGLGSGTISLPKPSRIVPDAAQTLGVARIVFLALEWAKPLHVGSVAMQKVVGFESHQPLACELFLFRYGLGAIAS
jgi:hypothetical protein